MSEFFKTEIHYATSVLDQDIPAVPQLIAGDSPAFSSSDVEYPAGTYTQHQALTTGNVPWTGSGPITGLTGYAFTGPKRATKIHAGMFNIDFINFPVGVTEKQVEDATQEGMVKFRKFLYSDKRTGNEILGVYAGKKLTLPFTPANGTLAPGQQGVALSGRTFTVSGATGTVTYKAESALPAGTSFNTSTGAWTGTPSAQGTYTLRFSAIDEAGNIGVGQYTIVIAAP